jgi:hypothetical protein
LKKEVSSAFAPEIAQSQSSTPSRTSVAGASGRTAEEKTEATMDPPSSQLIAERVMRSMCG